jgi:hypothetical protein
MWSWVGFEMAPNYAEEARNPKKMMAYAIYISHRPRRLLHVLVLTPISVRLLQTAGVRREQHGYAEAPRPAPDGNHASAHPVAQQFAGVGA